MLTKKQFRAIRRIANEGQITLSYPPSGIYHELRILEHIRCVSPVGRNGAPSVWVLTDTCKLAYEDYKVYRSNRRKDEVRWVVSTLVALAALAHSIFFRD